MTESPAKELYFEPGWNSYEKLRLKAGFREKNLFGTGRIFGLDAAVSLKAQSLIASLSDPWFLNTDITADLPVFYNQRKQPPFTRQDLGGSLLFSKKLTDRLSASEGQCAMAFVGVFICPDTFSLHQLLLKGLHQAGLPISPIPQYSGTPFLHHAGFDSFSHTTS